MSHPPATYHVTASVVVLPPAQQADLRADLLSRIYRRMCEQMSALRTPGPSVDWRVAAMQARAQVSAVRKGEDPAAIQFQPAG